MNPAARRFGGVAALTAGALLITMFSALADRSSASTAASATRSIYPHNCANYSLATRDKASPALKNKAMLQVASFNIQGQNAGSAPPWNNRVGNVTANILRCMPDVIGLNEAAASWTPKTAPFNRIGQRSVKTRNYAQYENLIDQLNFRLQRFADEYRVTNTNRENCALSGSNPREWNEGPNQGWRECSTRPDLAGQKRTPEYLRTIDSVRKREASLSSSDNRIAYNHRTVRVLSQGYRDLVIKGAPTRGRTTLAWAIFQDRATGRVFSFGTTHLDFHVPKKFRKKPQVFRKKQAVIVKNTMRAVSKFQGRPIPSIVTGDFNTNRYSLAKNAFDVMIKGGWVDAIGHNRVATTKRVKVKGKKRKVKKVVHRGSCQPAKRRIQQVPRKKARRINVWYDTTNKRPAKHQNLCTRKSLNANSKLLPRKQWWKYNGAAIDYIFVSSGVRARTWETVVNAAIDKKGRPTYRNPVPGGGYSSKNKVTSDHNMITTVLFL